MRSLLILYMLVVCIISACASSQLTSKGRFDATNIDSTLDRNIFTTIEKLPAIGSDIARATGKSFVQSCGITIPLSLAFRAKELPNVKNWLISGIKDGVDLARVSAACAGGEVLSKHIRGVDDRANVWIGSGLSGAFLRLKKGPFEMAKGFGQMFALVYAVDQVLPLPTTSESKTAT